VWDYQTGSLVRAPALIVDQSVFVASTDGHIHAIDLQSGDLLWRYPAAEPDAADPEEAASFNTAPAFLDGVLYVTSREGSLHAIDVATGEPLCPRPIDLNGTVNIYPSIASGVVFVGLENPSGIHAFAAGACGNPAPGYSAFYPSSLAVRLGLVVTPDTMYLLEDRLLLAMSLDGALWLDAGGGTPSPWEGGPFGAADIITTHPVLADSVLYVGSQDGMVHAIDADSGVVLWDFNTESAVRGELVVVPGAVVVTTADGEVIAIAGQ
jgi:outer membrane protein assembly factor BamB